MTRSAWKALGARGLHALGADRMVGTMSGRSGRPLVLCYHRVVEDVRAHPTSAPAMLVSVRTLERQLDWVGRRYRFVGLDELARSLEEGRGRWSGRPPAAVTFDDGYADVYHHGFPLLRKKGIPGAIFVTTDVVGGDRLHTHDQLFLLLRRAAAALGGPGVEDVLRRAGGDVGWRTLPPGPPGRRLVELKERLLAGSSSREVERLAGVLQEAVDGSRGSGAAGSGAIPPEVVPQEAVPQKARGDLATMTWEMVRELYAAGVTVGSHTRTHVVLPSEDDVEVTAELAVSKRTLEERLGGEVLHLAYPGGQYCPRTVAAAEAAGYRYAYTTCYHGSPERPLLAIPRRTFWERSSAGPDGEFSAAVASCQVEGVFDLVRPCRSDHRTRLRSAAPRRPPHLPEEATP